MRVLWIIDGLGPGGAENMMPTLLKQLCEHGVESRVCALQVRNGNPIADEIKKLGIQVDVIAVKHLRAPGNLPRLLRYIRGYQPDIVHTQLEASDIFGTLGARIAGIPSVATLHTLDVKPKTKRSYWRNFIRWRILDYFCDQVLAVSEKTRQHYISLGIKSNKIATLYNGVDLNRFISFRRAILRQKQVLKVPAESIVVLTVAVLREAKGIQYMLNALSAILEKFPNVYYVIVGDGTYRNALESIAKSNGVSDHVVFLGHRSDIPVILGDSDLFLFPTLGDALPTVLLEAMAVGVPIISSNVGGVPEILTNGETGLLIPPADSEQIIQACTRLLSDSELAHRLSSSATLKVEAQFDVRKQAENLINLYRQLVSAHAN